MVKMPQSWLFGISASWVTELTLIFRGLGKFSCIGIRTVFLQEVGHPGHLVGLDCLAYQFGVVAGHDHQLVGFRRLVQEQAVVGQRAALYDLRKGRGPVGGTE